MLINSDLSVYIGRDALKVDKDFPKYKVRYFFPKQILSRDIRRDRINVLVVQGLVHRIWIG
jgi:hypothetical protein